MAATKTVGEVREYRAQSTSFREGRRRQATLPVQDEPFASNSRMLQPTTLPPVPEQMAKFDEQDVALLQRLFTEPLEYVHHELFEQPSAEVKLFGHKACLAPHSTYFVEAEGRDSIAGAVHTDCTLTTCEEILLFQRYNYTRMRLARLFQQHRQKRFSLETIREFLGWAHRAMIIRGQIVAANVPLVLAMAKRTRLNGLDFNDLISEGNFALLRSADKFDCARGFKFSTYACRAILKSFSRVALRTSRYRGQFPIEFDPTLEKSDFVDRKREDAQDDCVDEIRDILAANKASLNDVEQTVIRERFALGSNNGEETQPKTLEQVGAIIGVTKERVRQIQNKALHKIRMILEEDYLAA